MKGNGPLCSLITVPAIDNKPPSVLLTIVLYDKTESQNAVISYRLHCVYNAFGMAPASRRSARLWCARIQFLFSVLLYRPM